MLRTSLDARLEDALSISDLLGMVAIAGGLMGMVIAVAAFVAMLVRLGDPAIRTRALGFVYVGLSVVATSSAVFLVSRIANGRLPLVAGVVPVVVVLVTAGWLRVAASREFRRSSSSGSD